MNFISQFFKDILDAIYGFVGNYGWSVVLFTCLIKLVLLPLDIKSRKGMRAMTRVQPKLQAIQKKYANDKEKLNVKMQELYRKEKVSPMAGCLPLLLSLPILWFMFGAMRNAGYEHTVQMLMELKDTGAVELQSWLWIKNVFQPDSFMSTILPTALNAAVKPLSGSTWLTQENIDTVKTFLASADYSALTATYGAGNFHTEGINLIFTTLHLTIPNSFSAMFRDANGLLILPILAGLSQYIMTKFTTAKQAKTQDPAAMQASAANPSNSMNNGFMKWVFPIMSIWICTTSNAAFAIYWMVANVIQIVEQVVLDRILDRKEKREELEKPESGL